MGSRLLTLAVVLLMRGRVDEAVTHRDEGAPFLTANPEPQTSHMLPYCDGFIALARQDLVAAAGSFAESADHILAHNLESGPEVITECVRALVRVNATDRAERYRDLAPSMDSVQSRPHARNILGLLEPDPARASDLLREAIAEFERLEMRIHAARAMVDLGRVMASVGQDPVELLEPARDILSECDAQIFLFEVDEVLAPLRT